MISSNSSPQEHLLRDQISAIVPDAYQHLEQIASFDYEEARGVVRIIMQFCCCAQHAGGIMAGRNAFKQLPPAWVRDNLPMVIAHAINLEDAWEYRRLLELLRESNSGLLNGYIARGLKSVDPEIQEVASDFINRE